MKSFVALILPLCAAIFESAVSKRVQNDFIDNVVLTNRSDFLRYYEFTTKQLPFSEV